MFTMADMSAQAAHGWAGRGGCVYDGASNLLHASSEWPPETGLDYFGARYFSAGQGRRTSPDLINLTWDRLRNPSNTLNKYVYAANNPLKFVDPDGQDITLFYQPSASSTNLGDYGHAFLAHTISPPTTSNSSTTTRKIATISTNAAVNSSALAGITLEPSTNGVPDLQA